VGRLNCIMSAFTGGDRAMSLSDISHRVGLPKSTVHRLADQLCSTGWLERNSGGYRVGLKLLELGGVALQRNNLREIASRHLYPLAFKTGLSAQLAIYDQGSVVFLERISLVRRDLPSRVGGREPAYCTALGKALLAFQGDAEVAAALAALPRRTEATITDPRVLHAELETVRRTGVAHDRGEAYPGMACVAAPVRSSGQAIGAVSITGPADRLRSPSLAHDVRATALAVWEGRAATATPGRPR
jgi:DNA-binding IclR family transcriptional regulator